MALPVDPGWFDFRITLGNVVETMAIAGGGIFFVLNLRNKVSLLALEVRYLKKEIETLAEGFKQFGQVLTRVALQDDRLNRLEQDMRDMKHGEGYVIPFRRSPYEVGGGE